MTERERLLKLVNSFMENATNELLYGGDFDDFFTDYLLDNGVIVLPCKVGDTVWLVDDVWHLDDKDKWEYHYEKEVVPYEIRSILISCNSKNVWTEKFRMCEVKDSKIIDHQRNLEFDSIGKTVFLAREEAEKALKEREENA